MVRHTWALMMALSIAACSEAANQEGRGQATVSESVTSDEKDSVQTMEKVTEPKRVKGRAVLANKQNLAAIKRTRANVENVAGAVTVYAMAEGSPPKDLKVLVREGHLKPDSLKDPWGRALRLVLSDEKGRTHSVCSSGPDRRPRTRDDICAQD